MSPNTGDFGVTATGGLVGRIIRLVTHSSVNHAFVYIGDGKIVEAQPGGAVVSPASRYPKTTWSNLSLSGTDRVKIAGAAVGCVNRPYNYLDIAAQLIVRVFRWHAPHWALRRVSSPATLQCAQLVDYAYSRAGIQLFHDDRPSGLVAPSDLLDLIQR